MSVRKDKYLKKVSRGKARISYYVMIPKLTHLSSDSRKRKKKDRNVTILPLIGFFL